MTDATFDGPNMTAAAAATTEAEASLLRMLRDSEKLQAERDKLAAEQLKLQAEQNKLAAEALKMASEEAKLRAETNKLARDKALAPWVLSAAVLGGILSALAGTVAKHIWP
ncbi:hypothetical protein [Nitrospirillum sp. BR 11828]|uniref:hypothetical protein n=1 Tax=Nitrospirillum sp. BR 11828 TaxID=3104325 RepID=UPI002ACA42B0|nr:hypothetical protein [Nitrospirillum sp. BR 11828]MDZ5647163.1 hypothetical protein [Nitrospirillum sp. BR 11828]